MTRGSLRTNSAVAVGDLLAVVEDDDVVGNLHDHAHVVLDQQDRDVVLVADEAEEAVELGRLARIEAGGRLVEAEEERLGAHGAGDLEAPLRAIGQVAGRVVGAVDEIDLLEPVDRLVDRRLVAVAIAGQAERGRRRCSPRRASACCAARPSGFRAPSCRRRDGCSGRCGRPGRCGRSRIRACARAGRAPLRRR